MQGTWLILQVQKNEHEPGAMQAIVLHAVLIGPVPLVTELDTLDKRRILHGRDLDGPEPLMRHERAQLVRAAVGHRLQVAKHELKRGAVRIEHERDHRRRYARVARGHLRFVTPARPMGLAPLVQGLVGHGLCSLQPLLEIRAHGTHRIEVCRGLALNLEASRLHLPQRLLRPQLRLPVRLQSLRIEHRLALGRHPRRNRRTRRTSGCGRNCRAALSATGCRPAASAIKCVWGRLRTRRRRLVGGQWIPWPHALLVHLVGRFMEGLLAGRLHLSERDGIGEVDGGDGG